MQKLPEVPDPSQRNKIATQARNYITIILLRRSKAAWGKTRK